LKYSIFNAQFSTLKFPNLSVLCVLKTSAAMQVFKFGGASVNSIDRIKQVAEILKQYQDEKILVVISAMGKTTNALEKVVDAFVENKSDEALVLFEAIKQQHINTAKYLVSKYQHLLNEQLVNIFTEVEWLLHDKPCS
jgi:aspartate kinase